MDRQAVFTRVAHHLMEQGVPCLSVGNEVSKLCCFKNAHGLKCAIGSLIPDDQYEPLLEKGSLHNVKRFIAGKPTYQEESYGKGTDNEWAEYEQGSKALHRILAEQAGVQTEDDCVFLQELMVIHDDNDNKLEYRNELEKMAAKHGLVFTMP
jgi:hypothetical protein